MYKHILVPVDGSETARLALGEAIKLASALEAQIRLVHVVNKLPWVSPGLTGAVVQELINQLRGTGESILHDAMTCVRDAGIVADSRLIEALGTEAGECIIEQMAAWPADLIVCGTHGRRGIHRILMGSDAEYVLRHSTVPVLMVRRSGVSEGA